MAPCAAWGCASRSFLPPLKSIAKISTSPGPNASFCRQLLCVRLHHVLWPTLLASNCANAAALTFAGIMVLAGLISGTLAWVLGFSAVLLGFSLGSMSAIFCVEWLIRRSLHERQAEVPHYPLISRYMVPAGLLAQGLGFQGLIASVFLRKSIGVGFIMSLMDPIRFVCSNTVRSMRMCSDWIPAAQWFSLIGSGLDVL